MINEKKLYSLEDITVLPCVVSEIESRRECNPFVKSLEGLDNFLPIIAAPMDSVVDDVVYKEFWESGVSCIIPRTVSLQKRLDLCHTVCCAFGMEEIKSEFIDKKETGKLYLLIDIASGHMKKQIDLGRKLREIYKDELVLIGGNIANPSTYDLYDEAGFDYLRCGIGGGKGCLSSTNTSIHYPMASLLDELRKKKKTTKIIADGGIRSYSEVIKCLALGADRVMMGYTLSKTIEAAGDLYTEKGDQINNKEEAKILYKMGKTIYKDYHGMSTKLVQYKINPKAKLKTSEGRFEKAKIEYTLPGWTENMNDYLRSAMSYCGIRDLPVFIGGPVCQVISKSTQESLRK